MTSDSEPSTPTAATDTPMTIVPSINPDHALRGLRALAALLRSEHPGDEIYRADHMPDLLDEFHDLFTELDDWLTGHGTLPTAWKGAQR